MYASMKSGSEITGQAIENTRTNTLEEVKQAVQSLLNYEKIAYG